MTWQFPGSGTAQVQQFASTESQNTAISRCRYWHHPDLVICRCWDPPDPANSWRWHRPDVAISCCWGTREVWLSSKCDPEPGAFLGWSKGSARKDLSITVPWARRDCGIRADPKFLLPVSFRTRNTENAELTQLSAVLRKNPVWEGAWEQGLPAKGRELKALFSPVVWGSGPCPLQWPYSCLPLFHSDEKSPAASLSSSCFCCRCAQGMLVSCSLRCCVCASKSTARREQLCYGAEFSFSWFFFCFVFFINFPWQFCNCI